MAEIATAQKYTNKAYTEQAQQRAAVQIQVNEAAAWCVAEEKGEAAAANSGLFPLASRGKIRGALNRLGGAAEVIRDHHNQLMTNEERKQVARWALLSADGQKPKDRAKVSDKIKLVLRARHKDNKARKYGPGTVRLNEQELEALKNENLQLSHKFFGKYYAWCRAQGIPIDEGVDCAQDVKRALKMHEGTVKKHFDGAFGLGAELIDSGIMDPETKVISDPRRVLNCDETPQQIDGHQKGSRKKVAKRKSTPVRQAANLNRENVSVHMTWDLSGYNYGVQLVLKRKEITDDLVVEGPAMARGFTGEADVVRMQTRCCLMSRTAEGMQTGESFLQYLEALDKQITARSDADVAAGGTAIERPVVLTGDNHASRYTADVLKAATGCCNRLGIRLWTEEPFTSGFLQALDQYNSAFHRAYNKAKEVYKTAYEARYKTPIKSFGLPQFMSVLGGDEELGVPGMWFTWADPFDIITAWRKVGVTGNVFAPDLINRAEFIDQPLAEAAAAAEAVSGLPSKRQRCAATVAPTPPGMRRDTAGAWQAKFEAMREYAEELEAKAAERFSPLDAGILVPDVVTKVAPLRARTKSRLSDKHGSLTMQEVSADKDERDADAAVAADEAAAKRLKSAEKKDDAARARADVVAGFEACQHACVCPSQPCAWSGWKLCPACGPKKGLCKVRACAAARRPLALTHVAAEGEVAGFLAGPTEAESGGWLVAA